MLLLMTGLRRNLQSNESAHCLVKPEDVVQIYVSQPRSIEHEGRTRDSRGTTVGCVGFMRGIKAEATFRASAV